MMSVFVTFLEQGNAMPIQRQNFAGIADAYMDLYGVTNSGQRHMVTEYASSTADIWLC